MATKNVRVPERLHKELKLKSLNDGVNIGDLVTELIYKGLDVERFICEDGRPINMNDTDQLFVDEFGGVIPPDSEMDFRQYCEFVLKTQGVMRPMSDDE